MLQGAGLAVPDTHLRPAYRLPRRQQYPAAPQPRRESETRHASAYPTPAAPMVSRVGSASTRTPSHKPSAKDAGGNTGKRRFSTYCEEDVRACRRSCCVRSCAITATITAVPYCPPPMSTRTCTGRTTARRRWHGSRRAACRSTCRCGIWCRRTRRPSSASCCGSSTRATAAKTRSTHLTASGATRGSSAGLSMPASRTGRGWRAAGSTSTATPFA